MATVNVNKPVSGNAVYDVVPGSEVVLDFGLDEGSVSTAGNSLIISFDNGSTVTLNGAVGTQGIEIVMPDGTKLNLDQFAQSASDAEDEPAAGGEAGGGGTTYNTDFGNVLGGLNGLDPLGNEFAATAFDEREFGGITGGPAPLITLTPGEPGGFGGPNDPEDPFAPAYSIGVGGITVTFNEKYLPEGTGFQESEGRGLSTPLVFIVSSNDGFASLTINGVSYPVVNGVIQDFPAAGLNGVAGTLSNPQVTDLGGGEYRLEFTYTFENAFHHEGAIQGTDLAAGVESFIFSVSSINGATSAQVSGNVDVIDDVPFIEVVSGFDGSDNTGAHWSSHVDDDDNVPDLVSGARENHSGSISMTGGADGLAEFLVNGESVNLDSGEPQYFEGEFGTLTIYVGREGEAFYVSYEYEANISAEKENTQGGVDEFTFTVVDGDGDRASDTLTLNVNGFVDFGFGEGFIVDESYLWTTDEQGNTIIKGTAAEADAELVLANTTQSGELTLTANQMAVFTVNGQPVTDGLEIGSEHGVMTFTVSDQNEDGSYNVSYTFTLTSNFDQHENNALTMGDAYNPQPEPFQGGDWDEPTASGSGDMFTFTIGSQSETLEVVIEDDGLGAVTIEGKDFEIGVDTPDYNIVLCIDTSASMLLGMTNMTGTGSYANSAANLNSGQYDIHFGPMFDGDTNYTRMYAVQAAMLQMLEAYKEKGGDITVTLVSFNTGANVLGTEMSIDEAIDAVSKMLPGFIVNSDGSWEYNTAANPYVSGLWPAAGTNYNAGLTNIIGNLSMDDYETRVYFFSDGHGNPPLTNAQAEAWQAAVAAADNGNFTLHTVGIINATGGDLAAVMGENGVMHYIPPGHDLHDFANDLLGTLADFEGYFPLPDAADGVITQGGSADTQLKAFLQNVSILDEEGNVINGGNLVAVDQETGFPGEVTNQYVKIETELGTFSFRVNGEYTFTANANANKLIGDYDLTFKITFMDKDGDTVAHDFQFSVKGAPIDPPTIEYTYSANGNEFTVDEAMLAAGTKFDPENQATASGEIKVAMDNRLNLDEVTFKYTNLDGNEYAETVKEAGDSFSIYSKEGVELGTIEITGFNADGTVQYTFTLTGVLDNPKEGIEVGGSYSLEDLFGQLGLSVECSFTDVLFGKPFADADGIVITASGDLGVTVLDDVPNISLSGDNEVAYGGELEGSWAVTFGADGQGDSVTVVYDGNEYALGERFAVGDGFLTVNADGTWKYEAPADTPYKQPDANISFSIKTTDADGDPTSDGFSFTLSDTGTQAVTVGITTQDTVEGDGGTVTFAIQLSIPPDPTFAGDTIVQVRIGDTDYPVTVNSAGYGELTVPHGNDEDVYRDPSSVTATAVGVTGGNYEAVSLAGATATAAVADTIDTTIAGISLSTDASGDLVALITLSNVDGLDVSPGTGASTTVYFTINGVAHSVVISGSDISASLPLPGVLDSIYDSAISVSGVVTGFAHSSKEFEAQDFGSDSGNFNPVPVATTLTITPVDTVEGTDYVYFNVELSNAPKGGSGTVTVEVEGFTDPFVVTIGADGKGVLEVPNLNTEDVYIDASIVSVEVTAIDCGYSNVSIGQTATAA